MGKKIDEFVLSAAIAAAFYFFFQRSFQNRAVAVALALLGFIVLRRALRMLAGFMGRFGWLRRRRLRKNAGGAVLQLAYLPEEEALKKARDLLGKCYEGEYETALVQNHPSSELSRQQVFEIWKASRGRERLVICATCGADAQCRSMAATLSGPKVAIVDANALGQMIAEHPAGFTFQDHKPRRARLRLQHVRNLLLNRRNAPRCLLFAGSMLLMHVFSGNIAYLIAAMALVFVALSSLRRTVRPVKLF